MFPSNEFVLEVDELCAQTLRNLSVHFGSKIRMWGLNFNSMLQEISGSCQRYSPICAARQLYAGIGKDDGQMLMSLKV